MNSPDTDCKPNGVCRAGLDKLRRVSPSIRVMAKALSTSGSQRPGPRHQGDSGGDALPVALACLWSLRLSVARVNSKLCSR